MRIVVASTPDAVAAEAARLVLDRVRQRPDLVLGLATGLTMVPFYRALLVRKAREHVSFDGLRIFALDEYRGGRPEQPGSCRGFLERHVLQQLDVPSGQIHLLDGLAPDAEAECARYEELMARTGGIDVQILGIGGNGHIGFNEPGSSLESRTRLAPLSQATRQANARQWGGDPQAVPSEALTMGIGTILSARTCLLLAFGAGKAAAVQSAIEGPVTASVPASALQRHSDTVFLLDEEAAARLSRRE